VLRTLQCGRRRYLPGCEIAVETIAQQLHEADDRIQWSAQLVRDVGEELAFRLVRSFHVAVQPLQLDRSSGNVQRSSLLAQQANRKEQDPAHTECPYDEASGARRDGVRGRHRPRTSVGEANHAVAGRLGAFGPGSTSGQVYDRVVAGGDGECHPSGRRRLCEIRTKRFHLDQETAPS
jgi:hypothetical protein